MSSGQFTRDNYKKDLIYHRIQCKQYVNQSLIDGPLVESQVYSASEFSSSPNYSAFNPSEIEEQKETIFRVEAEEEVKEELVYKG